MSTLILEGLRHPVKLGCSAEERAYPQLVTFDIEMIVDVSSCVVTDDLTQTVCYMEVRDAIDRLSRECEWKLIEKMTWDIGGELLAAFRQIEQVTVTTRKYIIPNASSVTCRLTRPR